MFIPFRGPINDILREKNVFLRPTKISFAFRVRVSPSRLGWSLQYAESPIKTLRPELGKADLGRPNRQGTLTKVHPFAGALILAKATANEGCTYTVDPRGSVPRLRACNVIIHIYSRSYLKAVLFQAMSR